MHCVVVELESGGLVDDEKRWVVQQFYESGSNDLMYISHPNQRVHHVRM